MSEPYVLVLTGRVGWDGYFHGAHVVCAHKLDGADESLPFTAGAIIDMDRLQFASDHDLREFLCAVRYRAAWHHKGVVALTSNWAAAAIAEDERLAVCSRLEDAVRFLLSWEEAQGKRTGNREQGTEKDCGPIARCAPRPSINAVLRGPAVEITVCDELAPCPKWNKLIAILRRQTPQPAAETKPIEAWLTEADKIDAHGMGVLL